MFFLDVTRKAEKESTLSKGAKFPGVKLLFGELQRRTAFDLNVISAADNAMIFLYSDYLLYFPMCQEKSVFLEK